MNDEASEVNSSVNDGLGGIDQEILIPSMSLFSSLILFLHTAVPAACALAQAHWKLYPPSHPVTSMTSPMK